MREYSRTEIIAKGILTLVVLLLFFDSLLLAVRHIGNLRRINRYLTPDVPRSAPHQVKGAGAKKDYSRYAEISRKFLAVAESFQLQAILGDQAIIIYNNKPVTVAVGDKVGKATLRKIEGSMVILERDDGTEITVDLFAGGGPPVPTAPPAARAAPAALGKPPAAPAKSPPAAKPEPPPPSAPVPARPPAERRGRRKMTRDEMEEMLKRMPPEVRERARKELEKRIKSE